MVPFNGVKVFSVTLHQQREVLGETTTAWIEAHPEFKVTDIVLKQSSDDAFHCITVVVFYRA